MLSGLRGRHAPHGMCAVAVCRARAVCRGTALGCGVRGVTRVGQWHNMGRPGSAMAVVHRCCPQRSVRCCCEARPPAAEVQPSAAVLHEHRPCVCACSRERECVCVCARVRACAPSALEPGNQRTPRPGVQSQKPWPVSTVSCRVCAAPPVARTRGLWHVCGRHMPCQPAKPGRMQLRSHTHPRPLAFRRTPHGAPVPREPSASAVSVEAPHRSNGLHPGSRVLGGAPEPQEPSAGGAPAEAPRRFHGLGPGSRVLA